MKLRFSVVPLLAFAVLCAACGKKETVATAPEKISAPPAPSATPELHWLTDFEAAKAQARAENKMLLMLFTGSDWCPPCKMLDRAVFSTPEFAEYATKHLVSLEVDFPRRKPQSPEQRAANQELAGNYGIEGFPTVIVLDPNGQPLGQFGYVQGLDAKKVIEVLEKARVEKGFVRQAPPRPNGRARGHLAADG
jgi:thioredoxin-related protein